MTSKNVTTTTTSPSSSTPSSSSLHLFVSAFDSFTNGVEQLQSQAIVAQKRLEGEFQNLDQCVKLHEQYIKEYRRLQEMMTEVEKEVGEENK